MYSTANVPTNNSKKIYNNNNFNNYNNRNNYYFSILYIEKFPRKKIYNCLNLRYKKYNTVLDCIGVFLTSSVFPLFQRMVSIRGYQL